MFNNNDHTCDPGKQSNLNLIHILKLQGGCNVNLYR